MIPVNKIVSIGRIGCIIPSVEVYLFAVFKPPAPSGYVRTIVSIMEIVVIVECGEL